MTWNTWANYSSRYLTRALHGFHSQVMGAASIEYALVIMLIVITTIYGLDFLSHAVSDTLTLVDHAIEGQELESKVIAQAELENSAPASRVSASPRSGPSVFFLGRALVMVLSSVMLAILAVRLRSKARQRKAASFIIGKPAEIPTDIIFQKRHEILQILLNDPQHVKDCQLRVGQVMSRNIMSVLPTAKLEEIKQVVSRHKVRHLLVCDKAGKLLGVISDRDMLSREGRTAQELMTAQLLTVERDDLLDPAVTILIQKRISCLPVTNQGTLCGLLTTTDVMMALQCISQVMQRLSSEHTIPGTNDATSWGMACPP